MYFNSEDNMFPSSVRANLAEEPCTVPGTIPGMGPRLLGDKGRIEHRLSTRTEYPESYILPNFEPPSYVKKENHLISHTIVDNLYSSNCNNRNGEENMSLIVNLPCKNGDIVIASDSRCTKTNKDGIQTFSSNEQKIFSIEDSPIVLTLGGSNRFAAENSTIKPLVYSCKEMKNLEDVVISTENFLQRCAFSHAMPICSIVNTKYPNIFAFIEKENGIYKHLWCYRDAGEPLAIGANWCREIANAYSYSCETSEDAVASIKKLFDTVYDLQKMLQPNCQTIAPPTQILVGHPDGTVKRIE